MFRLNKYKPDQIPANEGMGLGPLDGLGDIVRNARGVSMWFTNFHRGKRSTPRGLDLHMELLSVAFGSCDGNINYILHVNKRFPTPPPELQYRGPNHFTIPQSLGRALATLWHTIRAEHRSRSWNSLRVLVDFTEYGRTAERPETLKRNFALLLATAMRGAGVPIAELGDWPSQNVDVVWNPDQQETQYLAIQQHTPNPFGLPFQAALPAGMQSVCASIYWPFGSFGELKYVEQKQ